MKQDPLYKPLRSAGGLKAHTGDFSAEDARKALDVVRPEYYRQILGEHLGSFVAPSMLGGRSAAVVVDFSSTGASLRAAYRILTAYYGGKVKVIPFAITEEKVSQGTVAVDSSSGVDVKALAEVMEATTYKRSHRASERYDAAGVAVDIQNRALAHAQGKSPKPPKYVKPGENKGAMKNIDSLLDYGRS